MSDFTPIDWQEELRKRNLLQQMTPVPPSMQMPSQVQPPGPQDPYAMAAQATKQMQESAAQSQPILQDVRRQLGQVQPPSQAAYQQSAQALSGVGPAPNPRDFPRNKLLMAVTAPLMAKGFLANPRKTMENLDYLTRRGYGAAEQQYEQNLIQRERDFDIQSRVMNQNNKVFADSLSTARSRIEAEQAINNLNNSISSYPMQSQLLAAQIAEATQRAIREKSPVPQPTALSIVHYRDADGKLQSTNGYPSISPDGSVDWKGPEGDTIHNVIGIDRLPPESIQPFAMAYQNRIAQFAKDHPGETPNPADQAKIIQQAMQDSKDVTLEAQEKRLNQQEQFMRLTQAQNDQIAPIRSRQGPLNTQIAAIREALNTLKLAGNNTIADNMSVISGLKSALAGSGSRMANVELKYLKGGRWKQLQGWLDQWSANPRQAGNIPQDLIQQIREYQQSMLDEAERIAKLNAEYIGRIRQTTDPQQIQPLMDAYEGWVAEPEKMRGQQPPIEVKRGPDGKLLPPPQQQ